jgi:hypothetical protein
MCRSIAASNPISSRMHLHHCSTSAGNHTRTGSPSRRRAAPSCMRLLFDQFGFPRAIYGFTRWYRRCQDCPPRRIVAQTFVRRCHGGLGSPGLPRIGKSGHDGGASAFGAGEVFRGSKSKAPPSSPAGALLLPCPEICYSAPKICCWQPTGVELTSAPLVKPLSGPVSASVASFSWPPTSSAATTRTS